MSIEDFLMMHAPETTGEPLPIESAANVDLAMLVKMASDGRRSPSIRPARRRARRWRGGKATFYRRVGERNHACADCHTPDKGRQQVPRGPSARPTSASASRATSRPGARTRGALDMRKRFQWCMTPLGMNMLAADSIEYAELELYLTSSTTAGRSTSRASVTDVSAARLAAIVAVAVMMPVCRACAGFGAGCRHHAAGHHRCSCAPRVHRGRWVRTTISSPAIAS